MRNSKWWIYPLFAVVFFASRASFAQAARTGVGVGAEATTTGIVGGTFVYDGGMFHIDALLGARFESNSSTVAVAGRLFFPVHKSQSADFSVGPGLGVVHTTPHPPAGSPPQDSVDDVHAEGAVQIRAFIVPNVALSASAGLGLVFTKGNNSAVIGGTVGANLGVTYFFF